MNNRIYDGVDYKGKKYQKVKPLDWQEKRYANKRFGKLLIECPVWVEGMVTSPDNTNAIWLTHCDCGNDYCISMQWIRKELKKGLTPDCGCGEREEWSKKYIGQTYNFLTILARDEEYKNKLKPSNANAYYKCQCKCGNIITARINSITSGEIKSCGCLKKLQDKINLIPSSMHNLKGQKFGYLTPIESFQKVSGGDYWWKCICDCGKIHEVRGYSLLNGDTTSCGCRTISKGEEQIQNILDANNITYCHDKEYFKDLLLPSNCIGRYDFILINANNEPYRIIEYDGKQHFQPIEYFGGDQGFIVRKQNDQIKNQYAFKHNIPIVRIPYTEKHITLELLFSDQYLIKEFN